MREIHVVATQDEPYGWYAESPQVPGLLMMRTTPNQLADDLPQLLRDLGEEGPITVIGHRQVRVKTDGHPDALLRVQEGDDMAARVEVVERISAILQSDPAQGMLDSCQPNDLGDVVFVAALATDTLGSIIAQMDDDALVVIAAGVADLGVWTNQLAVGASGPGPEWRSLNEFGWDESTTVSELMLTLDRSAEKRPGLLVSA